MMQEILKPLLESDVLTDEVKNAIETSLTEAIAAKEEAVRAEVEAVAKANFEAAKTKFEETYKILEETLNTEQYAIAFKKGDQELRDVVNADLKKLTEDGTVAKLAEKYEISDMVTLK